MTGQLIAFDRHLNLLLRNAVEDAVVSVSVNADDEGVVASGKLKDAVDAEMHLARAVPLPVKRRLQRSLPQLLIRGDSVVSVRRINKVIS